MLSLGQEYENDLKKRVTKRKVAAFSVMAIHCIHDNDIVTVSMELKVGEGVEVGKLGGSGANCASNRVQRKLDQYYPSRE